MEDNGILEIDWNETPHWANWAVVNEDGRIMCHENQPHAHKQSGEWHSTGRVGFTGNYLILINVDWFTARTKRPDGLEHHFDFGVYQRLTHKTAVYPPEQALPYLTLGLVGEAGEIANKVKKIIRKDKKATDDIVGEMGDVLWYLSELSTALGINLSDVARANIRKLQDRQNRGVIKGSGDER